MLQELRGPVAGGGEYGRGERQVLLSRDEGCAHTKKELCPDSAGMERVGILFSVQ